MPVLVCPRCATRLTVSDWAPTLLTCPNCLGRVENAYGAPPGSLPSSTMPRRVIPIERQVAGDTRLASIMLFALAALLGVAAALTFGAPGLRRIFYGLALMALFTLTAGLLHLLFPESEEVRVIAGVFGSAAKAIVALILIVVGVALLLLGFCYVLVSGT